MLARLALIACALCMLQSATSAETAHASENFCRQQLPSTRDAWLHGVFDAPPAASAVMVDAIDGKLPQVRQDLASFPAAEQARWRQIAMVTAASFYQPAVVDGLLDDGAAVDGLALLPPFKQAFADQVLDAAGHDPRFGGPATIKALQSQGLVENKANPYGPALVLAAKCDDAVTLNVLLSHHAHIMTRQAPNIVDTMLVAIVNGYTDIIRNLLDHGDDPCAEDQHFQKHGTTLASIGTRKHLPDALVQRLTCHAPTAATAP